MFLNALKMAGFSGRLILRNKAFIVVVILVPLLSTLGINLWYRLPFPAHPETVYELSSADEQMAYQIDFNRFPVKVYDTVMDESSDTVCSDLSRSGMFQIFRVDASAMTAGAIEESYRRSAMEDRLGAVIVLHDDPSDTEIYSVGEDDRFDLLLTSLENELAGGDAVTAPSVTFVAGGTDEVDYYGIRNFSYCLAFASIAFVFGGVLILSTVLSEKKDNVFNRLMLTNADRGSYFLSKIILSVVVSLGQALIMTVCFALTVKGDIGLTYHQFLTVLFLTGLVLNLMSLSAGLFCNSMAAGGLFSVMLWCMSAMISGTYFDISESSELFRKAALIMPQRWAMIASTRFSRADSSGYLIILCATAAYLFIIFVIGILGLRVREEE